MSKEELRSFRLNSLDEPTDEMLEAIMEGVAETARITSVNARKELDRRFEEIKLEMAIRRMKRAMV